jgi:hypothetical protein
VIARGRRWEHASPALAGARARSGAVIERDRKAMLRALADEDALRVFGQVVLATGTGLPERSGGSTSIRYVTAHGVSRRTGLPVSVVLGALTRLTESRLTIESEDGAAGGPILGRFAERPMLRLATGR